MLDVTRLPIVRQRRVAQSLIDLSTDKNTLKSLDVKVKDALGVAVTVGRRLDAGRELPALVLDNTTDTVFAAFDTTVDAIERGMDDRVVKPLPAIQAKKKAAASTIRLKAIPDGMPFLSLSMPLQYDAMRTVMDLLEKDAECVAAVKELDLAYFVEHMAAHLAPYGRAVKTADGRDLEAEGDAFHAAFVKLAVQASAQHAEDDAVRKQILGAYEKELLAHREDERARRRARKKKQEE
jgi:hypothetical protein